MKYKNCTCTYYQLKERGYSPISHAKNCPMYIEVNLVTPKRIKPPEGINPYEEINRFKEL